jgi:hypothetical protein
MEENLNYGILPGEHWLHYKGGNYKIITLANHTETKEPFVIYQSISFGSIYARPLSIWSEIVDTPDGSKPRFVKVENTIW